MCWRNEEAFNVQILWMDRRVLNIISSNGIESKRGNTLGEVHRRKWMKATVESLQNSWIVNGN